MQVPNPNWNPTPTKGHLVLGIFWSLFVIVPIILLIINSPWLSYTNDPIWQTVLAFIIYFIFVGGMTTLNIIAGIRAIKRQNLYKKAQHHKK